MGAGPEALADGGLVAQLEGHGHNVCRTVVERPGGGWAAEIRTAFDLAANVARAVRSTRSAGRLPVILAGNCGVALGVVSALDRGTAVLWADAHGDFNTPETTVGGFLDGMALACVVGRCWMGMSAQVPGYAPVAEDLVWLLGARDLDSLEEEALEHSSVHRIPAGEAYDPAVDTDGRALAAALRAVDALLHG